MNIAEQETFPYCYSTGALSPKRLSQNIQHIDIECESPAHNYRVEIVASRGPFQAYRRIAERNAHHRSA